jgi:drug/metabolite transporter (DMT)-like permease
MKYIALQNPRLLDLLNPRDISTVFILLFRAGIPAAISLCLTIIGYTKFGFLQLMIMQAFFYPLAFLVDHFLFKEIWSTRMFLSSILITMGVLLAIKK